VYSRPRLLKRDQPAYKVKSVLQGTENDGLYIICLINPLKFGLSVPVSRQELVGWLQQQIAEQKRRDMSTHGSSVTPDAFQGALSGKDVSSVSDVQLVLPADTKLPGDAKKQRKQVKHLFLDRGK
jgi:eukaryotic translation initiation factor 2-alpha kinase 4